MKRISLLIAVLLIGQMLAAQSIRVMTYNIRFDNPGDGVNQWSNRKEKVVALIKKYDPDLIGIQEALLHQLNDIISLAPEYDFYGVGRDDGKEKGEYSAVMYKKEKFELLDKNTMWLSETPKVPGSKSWDAAITRILTATTMKEKSSDLEFRFLNTHFDHVGKEARQYSAVYIKGAIAGMQFKKELPVILTGDFNVQRDQPPYQMLTRNPGPELFDTKPATDSTGTYCGFKVGAMPCTAIDFIFHTKHWKVLSYEVIQDNDGTHYPSDHLPVIAVLETGR
ncbi:MAG: endonuclease/exonuclease/phosphatase family protein [Cyclobacteriaceae bacterium]